MTAPTVSVPLPRAEAANEPVRLGLVALSTDMTLEHDLAGFLSEDLRLHVSRLAFANPTTPENLRAMAPGITAAADLLVPGVDLAAVGFGCTSGAIINGDGAVAAAIGAVRPGVPVCTPSDSAVRGFRDLGVRRIALLTPYVEPTARPVADYFETAGIEVVQLTSLDMEDDRDIARLSPAVIRAAVLRADHAGAEAVFISCTSTPVMPLIPALEAELGKPVVSSNQALAWAMLAVAGLSVPGPGALFAPTADAA
ncbi:MAG: maleate isomerase [Rhodobacteraceae bacterium HLUCCA12]|nr:MAG: maleate isomerase [Rhodobacteraceae bacterium HLUCCA12]